MTATQSKGNDFFDAFNAHTGKVLDDLERKSKESREASGNSIDYESLLAAARVRPTDQIDKPVACWSIEQDGIQTPVGTLGNLSTLIGKAKAKKTFLVTIAIAAAVSSALVLNRIIGQLQAPGNTVLFFDTEQSKYHVLRIIKRICRLCGIDDPPNLIVYSLRPFSPGERLKIIDWALHNTPDIGLVVIDGARDLAVDPILDAQDASLIMTHLLKWTDLLNIHILTVLHQNKNDLNARGHLGTELVNKSETVISITRDSNDKEVSVVAPEYCRDKEFEEFRFSVDSTGLPYLVEEQTDGLESIVNTRSGPLKVTRIIKAASDAIDPVTVRLILVRAFAQDEHLAYAQLRTNIIEASEHAGSSLSKSKAEAFIQRMILNSYLDKFRPEKSRWDAYQINPDYLNDSTVPV